MPHLSPMNWLMAITFFWLSLLMIFSSQWWSQPSKFSTPSTSQKSNSSSAWKW